MTGPDVAPVASAPGKILLAGEYAVLDGAPAILTAVDRRAVATAAASPRKHSPFLAAVVARVGQRYGADSEAARLAARVVVDSDAFASGGRKLGLGSSAAVTVAATAAALTAAGDPVPRADLHAIAHLAHGDGQQPRGSRGSGADIAASVYGGVIAATQRDESGMAPLDVQRVTLPPGVTLIPVWTGTPASTGPLVAAVRALRRRDRGAYERIIAPVAALAELLATSGGAAGANSIDVTRFVEGVDVAGRAIAELGAAAGVDLWIEAHSEVARVASEFAGAAKPTGAGGGDLALIAVPSSEAAGARAELARRGLPAVDLGLESDGVRIETPASGRIHPEAP